MERKKREKEEQVTYKLEQAIALWDPQTAAESTTDPFRTLFVARINFYTSESKLRREFETYGPIKQIKMITDQKTGKPRGYCFIEFEHEKDMHCKYLYIVICSPQEKLPSGCSVPNRGIPIKFYSSSLLRVTYPDPLFNAEIWPFFRKTSKFLFLPFKILWNFSHLSFQH